MRIMTRTGLCYLQSNGWGPPPPVFLVLRPGADFCDVDFGSLRCFLRTLMSRFLLIMMGFSLAPGLLWVRLFIRLGERNKLWGPVLDCSTFLSIRPKTVQRTGRKGRRSLCALEHPPRFVSGVVHSPCSKAGCARSLA